MAVFCADVFDRRVLMKNRIDGSQGRMQRDLVGVCLKRCQRGPQSLFDVKIDFTELHACRGIRISRQAQIIGRDDKCVQSQRHRVASQDASDGECLTVRHHALQSLFSKVAAADGIQVKGLNPLQAHLVAGIAQDSRVEADGDGISRVLNDQDIVQQTV